jgi:hypothetical protein
MNGFDLGDVLGVSPDRLANAFFFGRRWAVFLRRAQQAPAPNENQRDRPRRTGYDSAFHGKPRS